MSCPNTTDYLPGVTCETWVTPQRSVSTLANTRLLFPLAICYQIHEHQQWRLYNYVNSSDLILFQPICIFKLFNFHPPSGSRIHCTLQKHRINNVLSVIQCGTSLSQGPNIFPKSVNIQVQRGSLQRHRDHNTPTHWQRWDFSEVKGDLFLLFTSWQQHGLPVFSSDKQRRPANFSLFVDYCQLCFDLRSSGINLRRGDQSWLTTRGWLSWWPEDFMFKIFSLKRFYL